MEGRHVPKISYNLHQYSICQPVKHVLICASCHNNGHAAIITKTSWLMNVCGEGMGVGTGMAGTACARPILQRLL